ncbi:alpha/beta hydrolase [Alloscardovia theropitheci]|uniref:Alpha/beta hydrolase n=1 Tax=Alloscardovia theropitheci TaxID=2496842 RepID=A0A4R0QXF3_9BIFI|nr:alpha/beta hydrolase [Alloscardovia theropitheci]TCD54270.1 alpha/beta hydrolase [Alloscardovia theropitheci]
MQYFTRTLSYDGSASAQLYAYLIDNSPEINPHRIRPAILIFPGGGYNRTTDREAESVALQFLAAGYHAFILRYSVKPAVYPTALIQAALAMQTIRENSKAWNVDASAIAVLGFSAGGHLAANLATSAGDSEISAHGFDISAIKPNALMLSYPVISSGQFAHQGSFNCLLGENVNDENLRNAVSLEKHVDSSTPPTFIWHTITDDTVPVENSLVFIQACLNVSVSIEAHLLPTGGHGLSLGTAETADCNNPATREESVAVWMSLALAWIERVFGKLNK